MSVLHLKDIESYGGHGCLPQEKDSLGLFRTNVILHVDFSKCAQDDKISSTVDYVAASETVLAEMGINSRTVEHLAYRIADALLGNFDLVQAVEVVVSKVNPPVKGVGEFIVSIQKSR
jgi:dihydroneopterin aldolase